MNIQKALGTGLLYTCQFIELFVSVRLVLLLNI